MPTLRIWRYLAPLCLVISVWAIAQAQFGRRHRVTQAGKLNPIPANTRPGRNEVAIEERSGMRVVTANGIPDHLTGSFPNRGNPNRIRSQQYEFRIPIDPRPSDQATPIEGVFGIAINGVPYDPGAAEFYNGEMGSRWQYEPLSGAIALGIDASHAHVQPNGAYHYHGLPSGLLEKIKLSPSKHSPLVGWAADGFPIYAVYGFQDPKNTEAGIAALRSSFQLRSGRRPGGREPGGTYDGTFVADYEYVAGAGDLDECNGRFAVSPEFPDGTYAYFLTEQWPVIPRQFRGTPSVDFLRRGPGPGGFPPGRGPPRRSGNGPRGPRPPR